MASVVVGFLTSARSATAASVGAVGGVSVAVAHAGVESQSSPTAKMLLQCRIAAPTLRHSS